MIETSTFNASMLRAGQQPCQNGLIWRPVLTTIGGAEMAVFLGFALCSALWGAYHQTEKPHVAVPAQLPPTQGHDRDMGTSPNTAANDEYGGVGLTHDASLLELDLDHDQR